MTHLLLCVSWTLCAVVGHSTLNIYLHERDYLLFPIVMFLSGWGLVIITRLTPQFGQRQMIWLPISVTVMLFVAVDKRILIWLRNYRYLWLFSGIILLTSTILLGTNPTGDAAAPQLWLGVGGVYFQPSELLKIILAAFLSSYLAEQYPSLRVEGMINDARFLNLSPRVFGPMLLMWGLCMVILVWQRDLGTAFLFFMIFLILLYVASGYWPILAGGLILTILAGILAYFLFSVVALRVDIWINPWPEADGRAYQIVQSLQAVAAGGIFGQGIGQGLPVFIPVVHSDFVFAALAEEWGLLGVIVIVICFSLIMIRGMRIATNQSGNLFYSLMGISLSMLIGTQSIMIMGGVIRLLPLTGVTLPFVSYGGSSLLISFIIMGLLLRLSNSQEAH